MSAWRSSSGCGSLGSIAASGSNDNFGHPAGDLLLARLAQKLAAAVGPGDRCYRLGGDEFCVLADVPGERTAGFLTATCGALAEHGEGFSGQRILSASPAFSRVAVAVRASHERRDGGGYPDALAGLDIPLAARIIAVCDTYSAMTSPRPYRTQADRDEARPTGSACPALRR